MKMLEIRECVCVYLELNLLTLPIILGNTQETAKLFSIIQELVQRYF